LQLWSKSLWKELASGMNNAKGRQEFMTKFASRPAIKNPNQTSVREGTHTATEE
jgi:hypothetical protein